MRDTKKGTFLFSLLLREALAVTSVYVENRTSFSR